MEKKLTVHIPTVPNFLKVGEQTFPISDFSEKELKEIGREWTQNLIERAKSQVNY